MNAKKSKTPGHSGSDPEDDPACLPAGCNEKFLADSESKAVQRGRMGVVAVVLRQECFLVIRRAQTVTAPGYLCFPGGGVEAGETEEQALVREMGEELSVLTVPLKHLWRSTTSWGTNLSWWLTDLDDHAELVPNPREVEDFFWMSQRQLNAAEKLLPSVPQFFEAWRTGEMALPIDWKS